MMIHTDISMTLVDGLPLTLNLVDLKHIIIVKLKLELSKNGPFLTILGRQFLADYIPSFNMHLHNKKHCQ